MRHALTFQAIMNRYTALLVAALALLTSCSSFSSKSNKELVDILVDAPTSIPRQEASSELQNRGATAVPALTDGLARFEESSLNWAAITLRNLGPVATPAMPELISMLETGNPNRIGTMNCASALAHIGQSAIEPLGEALLRAEDNHREAIWSALRQMSRDIDFEPIRPTIQSFLTRSSNDAALAHSILSSRFLGTRG